jgi:hypothetical protein
MDVQSQLQSTWTTVLRLEVTLRGQSHRLRCVAGPWCFLALTEQSKNGPTELAVLEGSLQALFLLQIPILEESQGCGLQRQRVGDMAYHCLPASLQLWPSVSHTLLCVLLKRRTQGHQAQKETLLISPPRLCQETWSHERLQQPRSG